MEWLFNTPVAHRGLHGNGVAENSMTAYQLAIDKGYNIEIDVHLLKDGKIAVFHDGDLKRVCGVKKKIEKLSSADLANYHLQGTTDTIPLLQDLLKLVDGKVGLLIEIKPTIIHRPVCRALVEELKEYKGAYAIQSFSPAIVKYFEKFQPQIKRGILAFNYAAGFMKGPAGHFMASCTVLDTHPDFIAFKVDDLPYKRVTELRSKGTPVITWTVKEPTHIDIARKHADNIIFEQTAFPGVEKVTFEKEQSEKPE